MNLILITNNIMTDEDTMVAIPVEEYEHLKECKARLIEIQEQQIIELRGQMAAASMASAISNAAPINIPIQTMGLL